MSRVDIPSFDSEYMPWIINFASVATANATLLNLTSGQTTNLTALATAFQNAYEDSEATKITAKSKVATKNSMRAASEAAFRSVAGFVNANDNVSDGVKADLGITITPSSAGPVVQPTDLVAVGGDNGTNRLAWSRTGNAYGTSFIIEAKIGESGPWTYVNSTTRVKYADAGRTPGIQIAYRVIAQRDGVSSSPSNTAVIYLASEAEVISLHKAA